MAVLGLCDIVTMYVFCRKGQCVIACLRFLNYTSLVFLCKQLRILYIILVCTRFRDRQIDRLWVFT